MPEITSFKRRPPMRSASTGFKQKPSVRNQRPKLPSCSEITNWTTNPLTPGSMAYVHTQAATMESGNDSLDDIYESTEPVDEYTELS